MKNTQILGICGMTSSVVGTMSGIVGAGNPRLGVIIGGLSSAIMLVANVVLIFRREP